MVETIYQKDLLRIEISKATEDDPFKLLPGNFCLAETSEVFNLPTTSPLSLYSSRVEQDRATIIFLQAGVIQAGMEADSHSS